jgi:hypothetical protein
MAVTITEANAINVVLRALYPGTNTYETTVPEPQALAGAAKILAHSASKALGAGIRAEQIPDPDSADA